ncbi:hypothetical protein D3C81_565970 [compost metagenome]
MSLEIIAEYAPATSDRLGHLAIRASTLSLSPSENRFKPMISMSSSASFFSTVSQWRSSSLASPMPTCRATLSLPVSALQWTSGLNEDFQTVKNSARTSFESVTFDKRAASIGLTSCRTQATPFTISSRSCPENCLRFSGFRPFRPLLWSLVMMRLSRNALKSASVAIDFAFRPVFTSSGKR